MTEPYWSDGQRTLYCGDAWELAETLEPESLDCIVTSPPYWGLRDYGTADWEGGDAGCDHEQDQPRGNGPKQLDAQRSGHAAKGEANIRPACHKCGARRVDRQFGLEPHPSEYIAKLVDLFRRLHPALKRTGTVWLNLGDSYYSQVKGDNRDSSRTADLASSSGLDHGGQGGYFEPRKVASDGSPWLRPKQLLLIPSRVAIALQEDGWLLRNDMIWKKLNGMPSSVKDRFTCRYEHIFLFVKDGRAYSKMFDLEAVREDHTGLHRRPGRNSAFFYDAVPGSSAGPRCIGRDEHFCPSGKNPGDVREWATQPFPGAHFAVYPEALPHFCLSAGCAKEVCAECGAGKVRVVEREPDNSGYRNGPGGRKKEYEHHHGSLAEVARWKTVSSEWNPTCSCGASFVGGTVLDPFAGAGTTLCVARDLGLRAIGFELSEEYAAMAARRIETWKRPKEVVEAEEAGQLTMLE